MTHEHVVVDGGGGSPREHSGDALKKEVTKNSDLAFSTIECSSLRRMDKALQNELADQVGAWFDLASGPAELPNGSMPGFFVRKIMIREPLKRIQERIGDENLEKVDAQTLMRVTSEVLRDEGFLAVFQQNLPRFRTDRSVDAADMTGGVPLRTFVNLNIAAGSKDVIKNLLAAGLHVDSEMIRFATSNDQKEIARMLGDAAQKQRNEKAESPSARAGLEMKRIIRSDLPGITPPPGSTTQGKRGNDKRTV